MTKFFNKIFRDKDGRIVLVQFPNLSLMVWILSTFLSRIVIEGHISNIFRVIAIVSLLIWSLQEVIKGSVIIRRILGGVVFVFAIVQFIQLVIKFG